MKKVTILAAVTLSSLGLLQCCDGPTDPSGTRTAVADFSYGQHQWEPGFELVHLSLLSGWGFAKKSMAIIMAKSMSIRC
jgi:hypothetical protein